LINFSLKVHISSQTHEKNLGKVSISFDTEFDVDNNVKDGVRVVSNP